ncbi:MAG: lytic transglycosylase domain-containing protein [Burkholderiales bacterium]|nr:lytic transglycosylase domain-containing protein [Burkholderiales bacterium]
MGEPRPVPDAIDRTTPFARRSRKVVSVFVLAASVTALALILHNQRAFWFGRTPASHAAPEASGTDNAALLGPQTATPAENSRYRALSDFVSRRYRVSQDMAYDLVQLAHIVGRQHGLDPLLIIAVIAIESRFNPIAESMAGARGLMQVIPKYHSDKLEEFGGDKALFDPVANIKVGTRILKDYVRLTGNLGSALQMYAGALGDREDDYADKVMSEQQRLRKVLAPSSPGGLTKAAARSAPAAAPVLSRQ